jgi:predicted nucleic acid binding AN1-type Zn finger protein
LNYFECQCGLTFCAKHRLPFDHQCQFDWKQHNKERLQDQNPKLPKNSRLEKI